MVKLPIGDLLPLEIHPNRIREPHVRRMIVEHVPEWNDLKYELHLFPLSSEHNADSSKPPCVKWNQLKEGDQIGVMVTECEIIWQVIFTKCLIDRHVHASRTTNTIVKQSSESFTTMETATTYGVRLMNQINRDIIGDHGTPFEYDPTDLLFESHNARFPLDEFSEETYHVMIFNTNVRSHASL